MARVVRSFFTSQKLTCAALRRPDDTTTICRRSVGYTGAPIISYNKRRLAAGKLATVLLVGYIAAHHKSLPRFYCSQLIQPSSAMCESDWNFSVTFILVTSVYFVTLCLYVMHANSSCVTRLTRLTHNLCNCNSKNDWLQMNGTNLIKYGAKL